MRPLTDAQRRGYRRSAAAIGALAAVAVLTGVWVGVEWPLGWAYGGLGILAGLAAGGIAFAVAAVAKRAPRA